LEDHPQGGHGITFPVDLVCFSWFQSSNTRRARPGKIYFTQMDREG
jgi:hypothetical protein